MVQKTKTKAYWTATNSMPAQYPWLSQEISCEVAIIGGGITAAMCAMRFAQAGYDTVMLSATPIGYGGTAASTGIMSLDGEGCLAELIEDIGSDHAMLAVEQLNQAMNSIGNLCQSMDDDCGYKSMDSLRYCADDRHSEELRREFSVRLHTGINAELLSQQTACQQFTFPMDSGVYSPNIGAQVDPYRLVHAVIRSAVEEGARIYENTAVKNIDKSQEESVSVDCAYGFGVHAKYIILAAGLDTEKECGGVEKSATMYTLVTQPIKEFGGWRGPCMIFSEDSPKTFFTVTPDNRILMAETGSAFIDEKGYVGGLIDISSRMEKRYERMEVRLRTMFPAIRNITVEYTYAARSGRTEDGLPVLGRLPNEERVAYALCCGNNGLLYAEIAGRLLLKQYEGEGGRDLGLFSPKREWRIKQ